MKYNEQIELNLVYLFADVCLKVVIFVYRAPSASERGRRKESFGRDV